MHTFLREVSGCFSVCGSSKGLGSSGAISSTLTAHKRIDSEMDFMQITEQEDLAHKHFSLLTLCKQKEKKIMWSCWHSNLGRTLIFLNQNKLSSFETMLRLGLIQEVFREKCSELIQFKIPLKPITRIDLCVGHWPKKS